MAAVRLGGQAAISEHENQVLNAAIP